MLVGGIWVKVLKVLILFRNEGRRENREWRDPVSNTGFLREEKGSEIAVSVHVFDFVGETVAVENERNEIHQNCQTISPWNQIKVSSPALPLPTSPPLMAPPNIVKILHAPVINCFQSSSSFSPAMYLKGSRPASRGHNPRKRKQDPPAFSSDSTGPLLLDNPPPLKPEVDNVVDDAKVKAYLLKLNTPYEGSASTCVKILLCNSEIQFLTPDLQESIQSEFGAGSVSVSDAAPLSIDRMLTVFGDLNQVLRTALFVAFLMNSNVNNIVRTEAYTLKSLNYKVEILVEASEMEIEKTAAKFPLLKADFALFDDNPGLHVVTLKGDFSQLFNCLVFISQKHPFEKFVADSSIAFWPVIGVHDGDYLYKRQEENKVVLGNTRDVLSHVFTKTHLETK